MSRLTIKKSKHTKFNHFRHALAFSSALPQLTLLGLIIGLFTGAIVAFFRIAIEWPGQFLFTTDASNFESLSAISRVGLICSGTLIIGLGLYWLKPHQREMSVGHVIDRLHNHQGHMPWINWAAQFIGGFISLVTGQSVGREGPAVHLGAGAASQLGRWLRLPNNSMTTLIACGVASGIATSFNTPLAGVIFAMEVIVKEYTIIGFVPVILASVMGTMLNQIIFANEADMTFSNLGISSLQEMPIMVIVGFAISLLASSYTRLHIFALRFNQRPLYLRLTIAALIMSGASVIAPEIMGLGYDTINAAVNGKLIISSLIIIALAKLLVTPTIVGLGIPGGLIGPSLMIGACAGAAMGTAISLLSPELGINPSFYILMGMAGMMAAVVNAPLAALVAVLELSYNPSSIFPAMLVIVVACISTRQFFKLDGLFIEQLRHSKRNLDFSPTRQTLRSIGIRSIMRSNTTEASTSLTIEKAHKILLNKPEWLIYDFDNEQYIVLAADLAKTVELKNFSSSEKQTFNLHQIPGHRYRISQVSDTANLLEALDTLKNEKTEAIAVIRHHGHYERLQGIVTLADIEHAYQPKFMDN